MQLRQTLLLAAVLPLATLAADTSTLVHQTVNPADGRLTRAGSDEWQGNELGTHVFPYVSGNLSYAIKLNVHTGRARIYRLNANSSLGAQVASYTHTRLRGTNATLAGSAVPVLFVHDSFTGTVNRFRLEADGTVDFSSGDEQRSAAWRDKNHFRAFLRGNTWMLFALDTATGLVAVGNNLGVVTKTADWATGYTSVDHLVAGNRTYRLLYKGAGNPYVRSAQDDEEGRLVIHRVGADGLSEDETQRVRFEPGWSILRFLTRPRQGQDVDYSVLAYNAKTGITHTYPFLAQNGLAVLLPAWSGSTSINFTNIEPFVQGGQSRILSFADDGAKHLSAGEAKNMGLDIHEALADKAIGYQFMVSQSGRVVYSRAWGASKLGNPDTPMTTRTRLDLGSVSKMITTTTVLKLIEQNAGGMALGARASLFLSGVPANSWVHDRTVRDFLSHTTGMKAQDDIEDTCVREDGYRMTCNAFYNASPTEDCTGAGCVRAYNNSNVTAQRKMIEYVAGVETTPELVAETYQRWARRGDLNFDDGTTPESNALSCRLPSQSYYFARCPDGSANCFLRNGRYWTQGVIGDGEQEWSYTCSAGSWMGSSRQMIQYLTGLRYGWFLGEEMSNELLATNHKDGAGDPTAIGWDAPWLRDGARHLSKNGYVDHGPVASRSYITRLPNNGDAVLLVNTVVPATSTLVVDNFRRATGLSSAPPVPYEQHVSTDAVDAQDLTGVDRIALGTLSNGETVDRTVNTNYVSAARNGAGQLVLHSWHVDERGGIRPRASRVAAGGDIRDVAVSDGASFATAVITAEGRLRLNTWLVPQNNVDEIQPQGTAQGPLAERVAIAKTAGTGPALGRVVTAVRREDDRLQLQVWDYDNNNNGIVARGSHLGADVREVAIKSLDYGATWATQSRVVTAVETAARGQLRVDVWRVGSDGLLTNLDGEQTSIAVSNNIRARRKIAIGRLADNRFFVAFIDNSGALRLRSYSVSAAGQLTHEASAAREGPTSEVAVGSNATVARVDGKYELNWWNFTPTQITSATTTTGGEIDEVAAAGRVLGAYTFDSPRKLRLRNWDVVR